MNPTPTQNEHDECPHLLTHATCSYCKRPPARRTFTPITGTARADALYMRDGARPADRRSTPASTARPWSGWRSDRPVVAPFYRRIGVHA